MRFAIMALMALSVCCSVTFGWELTDEQKEPWDALETQVGLGLGMDFEGEQKYMHPKACFWDDQSPAPIPASPKSFSYCLNLSLHRPQHRFQRLFIRQTMLGSRFNQYRLGQPAVLEQF